MQTRFFITTAVLTALLILTSCTTKTADVEPFTHAVLKEEKNTTTPSATSSETSIPRTAKSAEYNYDEYLPEVDFATLLFSFENTDENGKTYLYSDADYAEVSDYVDELISDGYEQKEKKASKKRDSYTTELEDEDTSTVIFVAYEKTGLTITIEIDDEN